MKRYLYLLPFKDNQHFKMGLCSDGFNRIPQLNTIYGFDLDQALIVSGASSKITTTERYLKELIPPIDTFKGLDGATEVRKIEDFDWVLKEIKELAPKYNLAITNLNEVKPQNRGIVKKPLPLAFKKQDKRDVIENLADWFVFYHKIQRSNKCIYAINIKDGDIHLQCDNKFFFNLVFLKEENREPSRIMFDFNTPSVAMPLRPLVTGALINKSDNGDIIPKNIIGEYRINFSKYVIDEILDQRCGISNSKAAQTFFEYMQSLEDMVMDHPKYNPIYIA